MEKICSGVFIQTRMCRASMQHGTVMHTVQSRHSHREAAMLSRIPASLRWPHWYPRQMPKPPVTPWMKHRTR